MYKSFSLILICYFNKQIKEIKINVCTRKNEEKNIKQKYYKLYNIINNKNKNNKII